MEAGMLLAILLCQIGFTDAAVTLAGPSENTYNIGSNVTIGWNYDNETEMFSVDWTFQNSTADIRIMTLSPSVNAVVLNGFNVVHNDNGKITLTDVQTYNSGTYKITVTYSAASNLDSGTGSFKLTVTETKTTTSGGLPGWAIGIIVGVAVAVTGTGAGIFIKKKVLNKNQQQRDENTNNTTRPQPAPQKNSLEARPMPAIPRNKVQENNYGHDGKGHVVSVNDHPMTVMNIPEKKAGILDPVHEKSGEQEQKKKKKKKKKKETPRETSEEYGADN